MTHNFAKFSQTLLCAASVLTVATLSPAVADTFTANGDWIVRSEDGQGYCTAVQGFSDGVFLTIGERDDGAISMAFDFQKSVFKVGETQSATIKVNGVSRTYSNKPRSASTFVLGVGIDDALRNALSAASNLTLSVAGKTHDFKIKNTGRGLATLSECIQTIGEAGPKTVNAPSVAPAQEDVAAAPVPKVEEKFAAPAPKIEPATRSEPTVVAASADNPKASASPSVRDSSINVAYLQEENERLKSALVSTRQQLEDVAKSSAGSARTAEMEEKIARYETEIQTLKANIAAQSQLETQVAAQASKSEEVKTLKAELAESQSKAASVQAELEEARKALAATQSAQSAIQESSVEVEGLRTQLQSANQKVAALEAQLKASSTQNNTVQKTQGDLAQAQAQIATLEKQLAEKTGALSSVQKPAETAPNALIQANQRVQALEQELATAKTLNANLQSRLTSLQKAPATPPMMVQDDEMIASLKSEAEALENENKNLKAQLATLNQTMTQNAAEIAALQQQPPQNDAETEALRKNLRETREQLDRLLDENNTLSADLERLQNNAEQDVVANAGNDWNLEKATRRYQEAQREIRRMGALLNQQRGKCESEKKEIEYMLFDPRIAEQKQSIAFEEMESELETARMRIRELEAQYGGAPAALPSVQAQRVAPAPVRGTELSQAEDFPPPSGSVETRVLGTSSERLANRPNTIEVSRAPEQEMRAPSPQPVSVRPEVQQQPKAQPSQAVAANVKDILDKARVSYNDLQTGVGASQSTTWKIGQNLFGTATAKPMSGSFDTMVRQYIQTAEQRCGGEFAAIPVSTGSANVAMQKDAYEIACINGQGGLSASLLFYAQGDRFVSIAHEGATAQMDQAMEIRDNIDRALKGAS